MRFDAFKFTGSSVIDLPMVGLDNVSSKYIVKQVLGLGPPDIDVGVKLTMDNMGIFQNARPQNREIVVLVGLNPNFATNETVSDLRTAMYGLISLTEIPTLIEIRNLGATILKTSAWVSKFETNIFSSTPEVQITFSCISPFLVHPSLVSPTFTGLSKTAPVIANVGNAPTGFKMEITTTAALASGWTLTDSAGRKIFLNYAFNSGDKITINTNPGVRALSVLRAGVSTNLLQYLSADSEWLLLYAGNNIFATSSASFNWTTLEFTPLYWGV